MMKSTQTLFAFVLSAGVSVIPVHSVVSAGEGLPGAEISGNQVFVQQDGGNDNEANVQQHSIQGSFLNTFQIAPADNLLNVAQVGDSNQAILFQQSAQAGNIAAIYQQETGAGGRNFANIDQQAFLNNNANISQVGSQNFLVGVQEPFVTDAHSMIDRNGAATQRSTGETKPSNDHIPLGLAGSTPGQSGNTPGQSGNTPGQSGNTPGQSGNTPGQSGNTTPISSALGDNNLRVIQGGVRDGVTVGNNNRIGLSQTALVDNNAEFQQYGENNIAAVAQNADNGNNAIFSIQDGSHNQLGVMQTSSNGDNILSVRQNGDNNEAFLTQQSESGNATAIEQDGNHNRLIGASTLGEYEANVDADSLASQIAISGENTLNLLQRGHDNTVGLYQAAGFHNTANVSQLDNGNTLAAHQTAGGSTILNVYQTGSVANFPGSAMTVNGNINMPHEARGATTFPHMPSPHPSF